MTDNWNPAVAAPSSDDPRRRTGRGRAFLLGLLVGVVLGAGTLAAVQGIVSQWPRDANRERLAPETPTAHGHEWARPIACPGLPNLYRVSDELYRGARPEDEGFGELKKLGVRTVINLESFHHESDGAEAAGLSYEHIYAKTFHWEHEDVLKFLRVVADRSRGPFFVHCYHGSDRTGAMVAVYRIVFEGWSKDEAIGEMTHGGFGFHANFDNLIRYIRNLDVDELKREAGITP